MICYDIYRTRPKSSLKLFDIISCSKSGLDFKLKILNNEACLKKFQPPPGKLSDWHNSYLFLRHRRKTLSKDFSEPVPTDPKFVKHCCFGVHNFSLKTLSEPMKTTFLHFIAQFKFHKLLFYKVHQGFINWGFVIYIVQLFFSLGF